MDDQKYEGAIKGCQLDMGPGIRVAGDPPEAVYLDVVAHLAFRARDGRLHVYFIGREPEDWPDNYWLPGRNLGVLFRPRSELQDWLSVARAPEPVNLILDGLPPYAHRLVLAFHRG